MKVFISQPMNGRTDADIMAERQKAVKEISELYPDEEVEVLDSFITDAPENAGPLWYLGKSLEMLSQADVAYFCKDWYKYRGCSIEHMACAKYELDTLYYNQK